MKLPDKHELVGKINMCPGIDIVILKRDHDITPFIVTGYYGAKDLLGEEYFGCTSKEAAQATAQKMVLQFNVLSGFKNVRRGKNVYRKE